jgi:3-hydroxyisobutyrate dehydrogenase-like beta-hydroxyacid dehydrogenase
MRIKEVDGEPGSATQIKLARSVFTKGFEALLVETFLFARRCGIESLVMESIGKTLDGKTFEQSAIRYMASNLIHAARKAHEMKDATSIMEELGVAPLVAAGAVSRLQFIADLDCKESLSAASPGSLEEICQAWERCGAL